jgi:hypothetical protein
MAEQIIYLSGKLNQDDSLYTPIAGSGGINSFQQGDYRYALNVRIGSSIENNTGAVENLASTLVVENYYVWNGSEWAAGAAPVGTNTAINKYEDKSQNKIYYFVQNSNGDDMILMFVKYERKIYELCKWSLFNFDATKFISCCKISKYLIFTDYNNAPRMVDTEDIFRLRYTMAANFSEYHISFAKWAPLMPPLVTAITTETNDFMKTGTFQFSYRYVYSGGFKSTLAPPSIWSSNHILGNMYVFKITLPGYIYDKENDDFFTHGQSKFYEFVDYIELVYRESPIAPWKLFQRHKTTSTAIENQEFTFKNNGNIAIIPAVEGSSYFDSVPLLSGACEAIDNRPMFADNLDEFDVPEFEVEDVVVHNTNRSNTWNFLGTGFPGLSPTMQAIKTRQALIQQFSYKPRGIYKAGIVYHHYTGRTWLAISPSNWIYQIPADVSTVNPQAFDLFYALGFNIPSGVTPPLDAVGYSIVRTNALNFEFFIEGVCNDIKYLGKTTTPDASLAADYKTTPASVQAVINDRNNASNPSSNDDLSRITATAYREDVSVTTLALASRIYFDCNNWINSSKANLAGTSSRQSNDLFYNFRKGDRIRFTVFDPSGGPLLKWYDEEIIEFTGRGFVINKPTDLVSFPKIADASWDPAFQQVEVYRLKDFNPEETVLFYEIGEYYPITQPGTAGRDFAKRDFRYVDNATVTGELIGDSLYPIYHKMPVIAGDIWCVTKGFNFDYATAASGKTGVSSITQFSQMNQDPKNAGGIWNHNNGRSFVGYEYLPTQFRKETQIRFGNKFLEDSLFIGINTFREQNQFIYPGEYGRIRSLVNTSNAQVESVGNVLVVIGEDESWSVYVNRTTLEDLSGRSQVSISDKVLGSFNTLLGSHGTLNPESVSKDSGRVIWWNAKRGVWVRYSRDGLTEFSKYGMKNWFKDLSDLLINYYYSGTAPKVISSFDDYHEEWIMRFDHAELPASFKGYTSYKCPSFSERPADKAWKPFFDYAPDIFGSMDNEVYSIIGVKVHIHEVGADFGSIYGVKKDAYIEPVSNQEERKNKVWRAVMVESSDKWEFPSIKGDWRSNVATQQESRILLANVEKKEDTYLAVIQKDMNTPNAASPEAGVAQGEAMRSKALTMLMRLDPSVDYLSVLNFIIVTYDESPLNPKK